ncbi:MAG: hypothetical protein RB191_03530 [Terriglobia bacterium]|nr:hypothetical protein [Terriglobia bacterium]
MARKKRDYRSEYKRRLQRAAKRGLSKSQARGHPRTGERSLSAKAMAALEDARLQQGLRALRKGDSVAGAARSAGLSPERLRKYITDHKIGRKRGRKWELVEKRLRWAWEIFSEGRMVSIVVADPETNSRIGTYLNAVRRLLETNDPSALKRFRNLSVKDVHGQKYRLETSPNTLYRLAHTERETPEDFYRYAI